NRWVKVSISSVFSFIYLILKQIYGIYATAPYKYDIIIFLLLKSHEVKKIAVTYDSLERLIKLLLDNNIDVYNDYYLLVDEWHILFNSYVFRSKAVKCVLKYSQEFKEVTYMTATPIEEEFILKEIRHLPIVEVQWEGTVKVNINPIVTNNPAKVVCDIIKLAINGKMFGNLHFFVNSVEFIAVVIKHLPPELVRVVCSKNEHPGKGNKTNQKKLGDKYPIASTTNEVKLINFYTSTAFEGCDIYDENGRVFIVSDNYKKQTLLDVSTLIVQICGRIRNSKYNTKINHIFNKTENWYNKYPSYEEFKAFSEDNLKKAKDWLI
ncbi:hypothetical protein EZS27_034885, partial [termite gut metagenome]